VATSARAFVLRHTRLQAVPGLAGIRLHLADDVLALWRATQEETKDADAPLPYWGFAWGGGLAIAAFLAGQPELVAGRRVLDLASGSGLCAIAAMNAGAAAVTAVDIDPFAAAAIAINARANRQRLNVVRADILDDEPPPDIEVILAGDCWYEERFAARVTAWLRRAVEGGIDVRVGDPDRRYQPRDAVRRVATYEVRSTTDLEDMDRKTASVYELWGGPAG
jgi:predicted nicotinamide N-methyase